MFLNKLQLIGFLGQNPELRFTPTGKATLTVSVATTEVWKDGDGNKQQFTEWTPCVFWGKAAETVAELLKQGSAVFIEGRKRTREYTDGQGQKRRVVECIVDTWQRLDRTAAPEVHTPAEEEVPV